MNENERRLEEYLDEHGVPSFLKQITKCIMKRFTITSKNDALHICNMIADINDLKNNRGEFKQITAIPNPKRTAKKVQYMYCCNISRWEIRELTEIIRTGTLDKEKAKRGITAFLKRCKRQQRFGNEWENGYLSRWIGEAERTLKNLD